MNTEFGVSERMGKREGSGFRLCRRSCYAGEGDGRIGRADIRGKSGKRWKCEWCRHGHEERGG